MEIKMKKLFLVFVLFLPLFFAGCSNDDEEITGGLNQECYLNGTCNSGLVCNKENNTCIEDSGSITDNDTDKNDTASDSGKTSDNDTADSGDTVSDNDNPPLDSCVPKESGCLPAMESEKDSGFCDGMDNDCDGVIDEGCTCTTGQTQPCFSGDPSKRKIGICRDGIQTCVVDKSTNIGTWNVCKGEIRPKNAETCNNADDTCDGCVDHLLTCKPPIDCSFDIGEARPFVDKLIDGNQIYDTGHQFNDAETATWEWTIEKGVCDTVLGTTSFTTKGAKTLADLLDGAGNATNEIKGVGLSQLKVRFQLSGSHIIHLKVTRANGEVYECEWVLKVAADGLRIELCWDTNNQVDIDLHMGKNGVTTSWDPYNYNACTPDNCRGDPFGTTGNHSQYNWSLNGWTYDRTENYNANGVWCDGNNKLPNPRYDLDNLGEGPYPENINLDNPNDGDTFRIAATYAYGGADNILSHPVINIYCGGTLKAVYGLDPQVQDFKTRRDFWKAVEIRWVGGYSSDECVLTPRWDDNTGYVVNHNSWAFPAYDNW